MPQVNLTKLSGQELRQRLDSSRARGDASTAYEILREMSARREAAGDRRKRAARKAQPHLVTIDMGDPLDVQDDDDVPPMPHWRPPELVAAAAQHELLPEPEPEPELRLAPEPEPVVDPTPAPEPVPQMQEPPLTLRPTHAPRADADLDLRLQRDAAPPRRAERPRRRIPLAAGFVLGGIMGVGLGWWSAGALPVGSLLAGLPVGHTSAAAAADPAAKLDVAVAATEPAPAPAGVPLDVLPSDTVAPDAVPVAVAPASEAPVAELAPAEPAAPEPTPQPAEVVKTSQTAAPAETACAHGAPADRAICADPSLQRLQTRLQQAYAEALEAHEDKATLRQRQLAWRDARNDIADPERLARLYEQRIQKLQAATAAARAGQH